MEGAGDGEERVHANKNRIVQIARTGGRRLFDARARSVFLEWFAATCNVKLSAERAGINYKTAFKHRMNDADFADAWGRALEQGYARIEAKLLETRAAAAPIGIEGDLDAPELETIDPALGLQLLREHKRGLPGSGLPAKQGRRPRVASNAEVRAALVKRLAAYGVRVTAGQEGDSGAGADKSAPVAGQPAPPPRLTRSPSPGNPGEDLG